MELFKQYLSYLLYISSFNVIIWRRKKNHTQIYILIISQHEPKKTGWFPWWGWNDLLISSLIWHLLQEQERPDWKARSGILSRFEEPSKVWIRFQNSTSQSIYSSISLLGILLRNANHSTTKLFGKTCKFTPCNKHQTWEL